MSSEASRALHQFWTMTNDDRDKPSHTAKAKGPTAFGLGPSRIKNLRASERAPSGKHAPRPGQGRPFPNPQFTKFPLTTADLGKPRGSLGTELVYNPSSAVGTCPTTYYVLGLCGTLGASTSNMKKTKRLHCQLPSPGLWPNARCQFRRVLCIKFLRTHTRTYPGLYARGSIRSLAVAATTPPF